MSEAGIKPPKRRNKKAGVIPEEAARANLSRPSEGKLKDLSFKVPLEFWQEFKTAATTQGMTMRDYLEECFRFYQDKNK
jgi:hypothetical protein